MQCFYIRAYYEPLLVRNYSGAILRSCDMYTHICHPQKLAWCFAGVSYNFPCRRRHIQISDCRWITWDSWSPSTGNVHPAWITTLLLCRWTPSIGIQGGHWCLKSLMIVMTSRRNSSETETLLKVSWFIMLLFSVQVFAATGWLAGIIINFLRHSS